MRATTRTRHLLLCLVLMLGSGGCAVGAARPFATPNTFEDIAQAKKDLPTAVSKAKLLAFHGTIVWAKEDLGTLFLMHVQDNQHDTPGGYLLVDCPGGCASLVEGHLVAVLGSIYDGMRVHDTSAITESTGAIPFNAAAVYDYDSGKTYSMAIAEQQVAAWQDGRLFQASQ